MTRGESILLFVNGDSRPEAALGRAVALLGTTPRRLTVVDVVERPTGLVRQLLRTPQFGDLEGSLVEARLRLLKEAVNTAFGSGSRIPVSVVAGTPFIEVIRRVQRHDQDLVVTWEPGREPSPGQSLGSTNLHLLRKCPAPVWVLGRGRKRKLDRVIAAIDPGEEGGSRDALNQEILSRASAQALRCGAELHVVHVWDLYGEGHFRHGFVRTTDAKLRALLEKTETRHREWLESTVAAHVPDGLEPRVHLVKGKPTKVLPEMARRRKVDLVVMGTVGRTGVPGLMIGNTAENVFSRIRCSILAVKPPGFETPVKPADPREAIPA